jgi:hypothetical protein
MISVWRGELLRAGTGNTAILAVESGPSSTAFRVGLTYIYRTARQMRIFAGTG